MEKAAPLPGSVCAFHNVRESMMATIDFREVCRRSRASCGIEAARPFRSVMIGLLVVIGSVGVARAADDEEETSETKSKRPNIYVDYNTQYTTVPPIRSLSASGILSRRSRRQPRS